jgi:hypothetical protein
MNLEETLRPPAVGLAIMICVALRADGRSEVRWGTDSAISRPKTDNLAERMSYRTLTFPE